MKYPEISMKILMKLLWNTMNYYEITMKLPWNTMRPPWDHHEIAMKYTEIPWDHHEIAMKYHETTMRSPWNCHEIHWNTMRSPWNSIAGKFEDEKNKQKHLHTLPQVCRGPPGHWGLNEVRWSQLGDWLWINPMDPKYLLRRYLKTPPKKLCLYPN